MDYQDICKCMAAGGWDEEKQEWVKPCTYPACVTPAMTAEVQASPDGQ